MTCDTAPRTPDARRPGRLVLPVILLAQLITPLSIAGTAVGLPGISTELGTAPAALQWVVNGFNVTFAIFTVLWGAIADRIGHARSFRWGVALLLMGTIASAASPTLLFLDCARSIAGAGAAAVITGATATISRSYHGAERSRAFAFFGTVNGLGLAAGPTVSGLLIGLTGWRSVFIAQAILLTLAFAFSFTIPVIRPEPATKGAMFEFRLLRNRGFLAMALIPVAGAVGFVTPLTYLPAALQAVKSSSPTGAGAMMLFMTMPVLLAPTLVHRITLRYPQIGDAHVCTAAIACLAAAPLSLLVLRPDLPEALVIIPMVLAGLGFGLPLGIVDGRALSFVQPHLSGTAAGLLNFFRIGSEAVFVALYSAVLTGVIQYHVGAGPLADEIAAGRPGHPDVYVAALAPTLTGLSLIVLILGAAFIPLYRTATPPVSNPSR